MLYYMYPFGELVTDTDPFYKDPRLRDLKHSFGRALRFQGESWARSTVRAAIQDQLNCSIGDPYLQYPSEMASRHADHTILRCLDPEFLQATPPKSEKSGHSDRFTVHRARILSNVAEISNEKAVFPEFKLLEPSIR